jgi:hypothetical protein
MVITNVTLFYNSEWWYFSGIAVDYCGKKVFIRIKQFFKFRENNKK